MATWQFVADMITASPAVLLDLNNGTPFWVGDGWNLSPAPYSKGRAGSPLRHGQRVTNSSAENRILQLPLQLTAATNDAAATAIQNLGLQLRNDNILKVQVGTANPVFFRTFADPDYALDVVKTLVNQGKITLQLEAEPFAYSPRVEVTGSPFTLSNDPAAVSNGCFIDIGSVQGDVETPLFLIATSTTAANGLVSKWSHISTRRRGTPSGYSNVIQAESMTLGTDAAVVVDAAMSGGNRVTVTPTTATMLLRLNSPFPVNGVSTVEARGEYVVYGRFVKTIFTDTWDVQLRYGADAATAVANNAVRLPVPNPGNNGPWTVNLGKVPCPVWSDPVQHGFSGVSSKAKVPFVGLYAQRVAGTGNMHIDFLYFMPADDSTVIVKWPSTDTTYVLDGTTQEGGSAYAMPTTLDEVITTAGAPQIVGGGGFPELIPGQTNRIHVMRHVDPNGTVDGVTNTTTLRGYYWPRWREPFRP